MKICIINHSDMRGGASIVSRRLVHALRRLGHDATMLVMCKESDDPYVFQAASTLRAKLPFLAEHLRLFAACVFSKRDIFSISIASDGLPLSRHPLVGNADAVILNWVNQGMLSLDEIRRIASVKKVVWTMHDMWNVTAVCHHAGECSQFASERACVACPKIVFKSLGRRTERLKNALYDDVPLSFVAVSSWLAEKAAESTLMKGRAVTVIPNAFPVEEFRLKPETTRGDICLPEDKKLIVMGAARLDDPVKGLDMAIEIFNGLKRDDAVAVFYGNIKNPDVLSGLRFPYLHLGTISQENVRELYAHADVVISTSRYETLPGTLIEGMAAGCTPVAFDSGGQRDIISNDSLGYLVPPYDIDAFTGRIAEALDRPMSPHHLRRHIRNMFNEDAIARCYLEILNS